MWSAWWRKVSLNLPTWKGFRWQRKAEFMNGQTRRSDKMLLISGNNPLLWKMSHAESIYAFERTSIRKRGKNCNHLTHESNQAECSPTIVVPKCPSAYTEADKSRYDGYCWTHCGDDCDGHLAIRLFIGKAERRKRTVNPCWHDEVGLLLHIASQLTAL